MSLLPCAVPAPPSWRVDWQTLTEQFEWIRAMKGCPQDPVYHAEGDVWTHLQMVCDALVGLNEWRSLPSSDRDLLFAAALLHDAAKPSCTRVEQGRVSSRGHSQRGAIQARQILWRCGASMESREQVCALVRYHQTPFHLIARPGLPGAGKDSSIRCHAAEMPELSLDHIREEYSSEPTDKQGGIIQEAKERARAVPLPAIQRMMDHWDVPDVTEAPEIEWWENEGEWKRRGPRVLSDQSR